MRNYKYSVFNRTLTAGLNECIEVSGSVVYVKEASDAEAYINVKPDSQQNDNIKLTRKTAFKCEYNKLYISAPAQPGKTITLILSKSRDDFEFFEDARVNPEHSPVTAEGTTINTINDNVIKAIGADERIRLTYFSLAAHSDVTVKVKTGTNEHYTLYLKDGSLFARNLESSGRYLLGAYGDDFIINLSAAVSVDVSYEYEITK